MLRVAPEIPNGLAGFAEYAHLVGVVETLRREAEPVLPKLRGRTVWMVNSTARSGGVAEMLPTMVGLLRDLGVATEWMVIESSDSRLFELTKNVHNLAHGHGRPNLGPEHRELFERVNRDNAVALGAQVQPGDVLVVYDPQPMPLAAIFKEDRPLTAVWRFHIGLDEKLPVSAKSREIGLQGTVAVLANAGLTVPPGPMPTPPYERLALRLAPDGRFRPATLRGDFGLLPRPVVTQVSR